MSSAPTTVENQFYSVAKITKPDQTQTSQLRSVDPQTGADQPVADLAFTTYAITRDAQTGRIYYVETGDNGRVAYWDPQTQQNTILNNRTGANDEFLKLAQAKDGKIYGLGYKTTDLYVLDSATGKVASLGTVTGGTVPFSGGSGDIAFDPNDPNRLFVITTKSASGSEQGFYRLYTIDLTTRQATFIGETGLQGGDGSGSLGFADGKLYASAGGSLYELNTSTGQPTLTRNMGYISNDFASQLTTRDPGRQPDNVAPDAKDLTFSNLTPGNVLNVTGLSAIDSDPQDAIVSYTITALPQSGQGQLFLGNPAQGGALVTQGQVLQPDQIQQLFFQTTSSFKSTTFEYTATSGTGDRQRTDATPAIVSFTARDEVNSAPNAKSANFSDLTPGRSLNVTGLSATDPDAEDAIVSYTITALPKLDQGRLFLGNPAQGGTLVTQGQVLQPNQIQQLFFQTTSNFKSASFEYTATSGTGNRQRTDETPALVSFTAQECQGCCPLGEIVNGNRRNNKIDGSRMSDVIHGKGGRDILRGHDCHDELDGGRGKDRLMGGNGSDTVRGRRNRDRLRGGDGTDALYGNLGKDRLRGGNDRDFMSGGRGDDWLQGNAGRDRVRGRRDADRILGGTGNDRLFGNGNKDVLRGNRGRDVLHGGLGNDRLIDGRGRDVLIGSRGDDTLKGGRRSDRFVYSSLNDGTDRIVDFEAGRDRINLHRVFNPLGIGAKEQSDFVQVVQVGADSHVQIDANGTAPGFQSQTAFILVNFTASNFSSKNLSQIGFNA